MPLELVLNELSLQPSAPSLYAAQQGMERLVRTVIAAARHGASRAIRTHIDLNDVVLAAGYTVRQWRNDPAIDREMQRLFRSLISKAPYLVDLPQQEDAALMMDCFHDEQAAVGFKVAHMLDTIALSIFTDPRWDVPHVTIVIRALNEAGEIQPDLAAMVLHASDPQHVQTHEPWIAGRLRPEVASGADLWSYRTILYPDLEFCDAVEDHLQALKSGDERLAQVQRLLSSLNDYSRRWSAGRFDASQLLGTPSPETDMALKVFGNERTFTCPDGMRRIFSWHQKLMGFNWRIHFFPDEERKQITVGYIGHHLRTPQNRT